MRRTYAANAHPSRPERIVRKRPSLRVGRPALRSCSLLLVAVLTFGGGGYLLGTRSSATALSEQTAAVGGAAYAQVESSDEALDERIEKLDAEQQVSAQTQQISALQTQVDDSQRLIVNDLMRNLTSKLTASRGATGYNAFVQQAKILVGLKDKLVAFEKTEAAKTVDLSTYSSELASRLSHIPTLHPIPGTYDGYGWRIHPILHVREFHAADDVGAPLGTPIKAAASGTVRYAAYNSGGGNMIEIDHGNGFVTTYMHCSKLLVTAGQKVTKGQIIGKVGSTGLSTESHLHFAVSYDGVPFNPTEILMEW